MCWLPPTSFIVEDCELDFGDFCLGGDFALYIDGDGYDFALTHAFSCGRRIEDEAALNLIRAWIKSNLEKPNRASIVRREYEDEREKNSSPDAIAAARSDELREMRRIAS